MKSERLSDNAAFAQVSKLTFDSHIGITLYQCAHKVSRLYASMLSPHGLTFPQYQVLLLLWAEERCTVGSLCAAMDLDSSTLTPMLKRLEAVGYVRRERDKVDERRVIISLTSKGHDFQKEAQAIRVRMMEALGPEVAEVVPLHPLLRKLSALIDRSVFV